MIEFRPDDAILIGIAGSIMQVAFSIVDWMESRKLISVGPSRLRGLLRRNFRLWLFVLVPSVIICVCVTWFGVRMVLPENIWLTGGIFASLFIVTNAMNIARVRALRKEAKTHQEAAYEQLQDVESHLKSLAEGPMIVDEELDRKVLQLRKRITEVRNTLGVKENDPNNR